jgi:hypothetical protein
MQRMSRACPLIVAFLLAGITCAAAEKYTTDHVVLSDVAKAALEQVEKGRVNLSYAAGPDCQREAVQAIATIRPIITFAQLQALEPAPSPSSYFVVTSLRISTENPEWAWFEGRFFRGAGLSFGVSRGSDAAWRVGNVSICFHC